jgi:hypothetical protein
MATEKEVMEALKEAMEALKEAQKAAATNSAIQLRQLEDTGAGLRAGRGLFVLLFGKLIFSTRNSRQACRIRSGSSFCGGDHILGS